MKNYKKIGVTFIFILIFVISVYVRNGNFEESTDEGLFPPLIFYNDNIYKDTGEVYSVIPNDFHIAGKVEGCTDNTEEPVINFQSNRSFYVSNDLYYNEKEDLLVVVGTNYDGKEYKSIMINID